MYQYGVPTKEFAGQAMDAEPKSASFTCPGSVSKMFPALISLSNMGENIILMTHKKVRPPYPRPVTLTGESCCGSVNKPTLEERRE